jgi:hypothetical protein
MLTSTECHEMAGHTLAQAERDPDRRTRLLTAHQAWRILEDKLRQSEARPVVPRRTTAPAGTAP